MRQIFDDGIEKLLEKLEGWGEGLIGMLPNLVIALFIISVFTLISRWVYKLIEKVLGKSQINLSLIHLVSNSCRIIVICLGIVFALGVLELQKTVFSLLAGVGVIGLALGFAFQDLASNFISGIMLAIRQPIKLGDLVDINGTLGTIEEINLRETVVQNFSGQQIFIPNKDFTSNKFTNFSRFGKRKVQVNVGIHYDNDPEQAIDIIEQALTKVEGGLEDPQPKAYVGSLGDSSVNLFAFIWYDYPSDHLFYKIQSDSIIQVKKDLEEAGFTIPFPIRTLDVSSDLIKEIRTPSSITPQSSHHPS